MEENVQPKKEAWDWAKHKPNNMFSITASSDMEFFKWWCTLIHPFVSFTPKEMDVISAFLKQYFELLKQVPIELVNTMLMSKDTRDKVIADCGITLQHLYVIMGALRKKKVFSDSGINPKIIPNIRKNDNGTFQLLILIDKKNDL